MELKDSMQCSEVFVFNDDATLVNSGKCLPRDDTQYGFKYYGINGSWMFFNKNNLLIDYYFGLSVFHCTFRFRFKTGGFELRLKQTEVLEIKEL